MVISGSLVKGARLIGLLDLARGDITGIGRVDVSYLLSAPAP